MTHRIGIIGAGSWGTALAHIWAGRGHDVTLWSRRAEVAHSINADHTCDGLPGLALHPSLRGTDDIAALYQSADTLVYALPAQTLREFITAHPVPPGKPMVLVSKGIEMGTGKLLSEVMADISPHTPLAILSGPNFAREIAHHLPAAATLAACDADLLAALQETLTTKNLRLYPTTDIVGAQCGGALKNVIAIACGVVDGLKLGDNARAALVTRGLAEMARLTTALGGTRETLMGLCGLGDLILCCTSNQSRNYRFGLALADGDAHNLHMNTTIEGVHTARGMVELAGRLHLDMPICIAVAACVNGQLSLQSAVDALMQRPPRGHEHE